MVDAVAAKSPGEYSDSVTGYDGQLRECDGL